MAIFVAKIARQCNFWLMVAVAIVTACSSPQPAGPATDDLPQWVDAPSGPHVQIQVDTAQRSNRRMAITMEYSGLGDGAKAFVAIAKPAEVSLHNVVFTDADGRMMQYTEKNEDFTLVAASPSDFSIRYEVELGGEGRHGNQGWGAEDFVVFDGRVFLLPAGSAALQDARIRFVHPPEHTVASAFIKRDGWWHANGFGEGMVSETLVGSCHGVGTFDVATKQIGTTELRVFPYSGWSPGHKASLVSKTAKLYSYFSDTYGFHSPAPAVAVWTPKPTNLRLFGGSFVNGTCYEHPQERVRNWQLLGHRIGHMMNKYPPLSMHIRDRRDRWFKEGWASYVEVISTHATQISSDQSYWNVLYARYQKRRTEHPDYDYALNDEYKARGDSTEYLHYTKGPLVVKMLEWWLETRTDVSLVDFMRLMNEKYGHSKAPFPVRSELEAFAGQSLDPFWAWMVDQPGHVVPIWKDLPWGPIKSRLSEPPAASVGEMKFSGDYLYFLAHSGDFDSYHDIKDFLTKAAARHELLQTLEVELLDSKATAMQYGLSPATRYDIARAELAYPVTNNVPTQPLQWVTNTDSVDGGNFEALLEYERQYFTSLAGSNVGAVRLKEGPREASADTPNRLAFSTTQPVTVTVIWLWAPHRAEVYAYSGEKKTGTSSVLLRPGWTRTHSVFEPDERQSGDGIVTMRVKGREHDVVAAFWQRGK